MTSLLRKQAVRHGIPGHVRTLIDERVRRGLTQEQLAALTGVTISVIKSFEGGAVRMNPRVADRIAAELNHTITAVPNT